MSEKPDDTGEAPSVESSEDDKEKNSSSPDNDLQDFTSPDQFSDITLVVEDKPIHAHKTVLSLASPVWRAMFCSDFKERRIDFVDLPGKVYAEMVELLQCVYPPCKKQIEEDNVYRILPLTDEYQIKWLKDRCEAYLVDRVLQETSSSNARDHEEFATFCVQHIYLAQTYTMGNLASITINISAELPFLAIRSVELYGSLDARTLTAMFEKREESSSSRIKFMELQVNESKDIATAYRQTCATVATNALKIKRMGNYVRICPSDDSVSCECDSCIYFGRYFEKILSDLESN